MSKRPALDPVMLTQFTGSQNFYRHSLGSGLIDQSQNMNVAAMQMADMKVWAHRS